MRRYSGETMLIDKIEVGRTIEVPAHPPYATCILNTDNCNRSGNKHHHMATNTKKLELLQEHATTVYETPLIHRIFAMSMNYQFRVKIMMNGTNAVTFNKISCTMRR